MWIELNGTIQFRDDKNVKYYVEQAGGFTKRADEDQTRLIRANGTAHSGGGTLGLKVQLGDVIAVPTKVEREGQATRNLVTILTITSTTLMTLLLITKI